MSEEINDLIATVDKWFHTIEVAPGVFTPGVQDPSKRLHLMGIPENLAGKRVLDIGPMEGYYSFICEERGAEVTAADIQPSPGLRIASKIKNSSIKILEMSVYELDRKTLGTFDLILFMGVFYHLRHPLLALDCMYDLVDDLLIVESQVCDRWFVDEGGRTTKLEDYDIRLKSLPFAQFYPRNELNKDGSNWWSPNEIGLKAMLESSGFSAQLHSREKARAVFHCRKQFRPKSHEFTVAKMMTPGS